MPEEERLSSGCGGARRRTAAAAGGCDLEFGVFIGVAAIVGKGRAVVKGFASI